MTVVSRAVPDHRREIVMAAGTATTVAVLAGVYALAHHGTFVMLWYVNFIIPAGALLAGMAAGSGFAVAGWFTGLKMTPRMMWSVAAQLVVSYFIAEYEEYRQLDPAGTLGFWAWFDLSTRSIQWGSGGTVDALGYGLRALEIAGFVGGGLIVPLSLSGKPYCERCRAYRRRAEVAVLRGGWEGDGAEDGVRAIFEATAAGRTEFDAAVRRFGPLADKAAVDRLGVKTWIHLVRCPRCADSTLEGTCYDGFGKHQRRTPIARKVLPGETVRALFDPP